MLHDEFLAFDEQIIGTTAPYYTSDEFNRRMARYDETAVFIVVSDTVLTTGVTISANLEHSSDGVFWTDKILSRTGNSSLIASWVQGSTPFGNGWGGDDGTLPKLSMARLRISVSVVSGSFTSARVRAYVALRDAGGHVKDHGAHRHETYRQHGPRVLPVDPQPQATPPSLNLTPEQSAIIGGSVHASEKNDPRLHAGDSLTNPSGKRPTP